MKATAHDRRRVSNVARGRQVFGSKAGQALTEFSLLLPALALIFVGVLDLGRAFHTHVAVSNAARVGIIYAQEVATPRDLTCKPTCQFITVGDIITQVKAEAQGGIDPTQMQVSVCLEQVSTCPATTTAGVASHEAITITVTVPFHPITPFVHLSAVSGVVSGHTFAFQPVQAAPTVVSVTATATPIAATPTATAIVATPTPQSTATPQPTAIPSRVLPPAYSDGGKVVTITWTPGTGYSFAQNFVYYRRYNTSNWSTAIPASPGVNASISFTSDPGLGYGYILHSPGQYDFYMESRTSGGSAYLLTCAGGCGNNGNDSQGNRAYYSTYGYSFTLN